MNGKSLSTYISIICPNSLIHHISSLTFIPKHSLMNFEGADDRRSEYLHKTSRLHASRASVGTKEKAPTRPRIT